MMVNKAIKTLKHHYEWLRQSWKPYPDQKVLDAIGNAISALEKQIPKKPHMIVMDMLQVEHLCGTSGYARIAVADMSWNMMTMNIAITVDRQ